LAGEGSKNWRDLGFALGEPTHRGRGFASGSRIKTFDQASAKGGRGLKKNSKASGLNAANKTAAFKRDDNRPSRQIISTTETIGIFSTGWFTFDKGTHYANLDELVETGDSRNQFALDLEDDTGGGDYPDVFSSDRHNCQRTNGPGTAPGPLI